MHRECIILKSSVAKHYGCKRTRQCGLIASRHSQVNRDFSYVRYTMYELLFRLLYSNGRGSVRAGR